MDPPEPPQTQPLRNDDDLPARRYVATPRPTLETTARLTEVDDDSEEDQLPAIPPVSLEEQLVAAKALRKKLRKEAELREILADTNALCAVATGGTQPTRSILTSRPTTVLGGELDSQAARTDSSEHERGHSHYSRVKPRAPKPFHGKTLAEARYFLQEINLYFMLSGTTNDLTKCRVAGSYLEGQCRQRFHVDFFPYEKEKTWDDMIAFVNNCVEDPENRRMTVMQEYEDAHQEKNQSVSQFATHLATLENQLDPFTERQRAYTLFAKLNRSLSTAIVKLGPAPETRESLITIATRIENADKKSHKKDTRGHSKRQASDQPSGRGNHRDKRRQRGGNSHRENSKPADGERKFPDNYTCYKCGKKGHVAPKCTNPPQSQRPAANVNQVTTEGAGKDQEPSKDSGKSSSGKSSRTKARESRAKRRAAEESS